MKHNGATMAPRIIKIEHMELQWTQKEGKWCIGYQRTKETHKGMHQTRGNTKNRMKWVYGVFYKTGMASEGGAALCVLEQSISC